VAFEDIEKLVYEALPDPPAAGVEIDPGAHSAVFTRATGPARAKLVGATSDWYQPRRGGVRR
jgi:hypothetical protein